MTDLPDPDAADALEERERVTLWRLQRLLELGVPLEDADELARADVDVHELDRLIRQGCPPELAARILA